tara:strand:- start:237 stop:632 length:396 start_codon:yes stop_codon:yes gene_type:complete
MNTLEKKLRDAEALCASVRMELEENAVDGLAVTLTDVIAEEGYSAARVEAMKLLGLWVEPPKTLDGRYITAPDDGAVCWFLDCEGYAVKGVCYSGSIDCNRLSQGNLFDSEYAAENEAAKRAYAQKMRGGA